MNGTPWWAAEGFWRKMAIWVTAGMFAVLIVLTFDSLARISVGKGSVPAYDVINRRIGYVADEQLRRQMPVILGEAPLFGTALTPEAAKALVTHGKKVIQGRNCINCHTLLGNGAYYAPDLTKAWLDPAWGAEAVRETLMLQFLRNPAGSARTFGTGRRMPDQGLTDDEARAVIAFLKWMSAIDTNGFPYNFRPIPQGG